MNRIQQIIREVTECAVGCTMEELLTQSKTFNKSKLSATQFLILKYLYKNQGTLPVTMTDISKKAGHSTAAATGLADRLEKLGYVQRLHDSSDRRKVHLILTKKGSDLLKKITTEINTAVSEKITPLFVGLVAAA